MNSFTQDEYDVVDTKLRRYSIKGSVYSFVTFVSFTANVTYSRAHELARTMSDEAFEQLVAQYKLETPE